MQRLAFPVGDVQALENGQFRFLDLASAAQLPDRQITQYPSTVIKHLFSTRMSCADKDFIDQVSASLFLEPHLVERRLSELERAQIVTDKNKEARTEAKIREDTKTFDEYDWSLIISSGSLASLTVTALNLYHGMPHRGLSKTAKLAEITSHFIDCNNPITPAMLAALQLRSDGLPLAVND